MQYKIKSEQEFLDLFCRYLLENQDKFTATGVRTAKSEIRVQNNLLAAVRQSSIEKESFEPICTMTYREFLLKLSQAALIKMETLHTAFFKVRDGLDIARF